MIKITENQCTGMNKLGIPAKWDGGSCSVGLTGSNLPIISGKELPLQVHFGSDELKPIMKRKITDKALQLPIKPSWGLWTSSLENKDCLCDWQRWAQHEDFNIETLKKGMILEPKPDAKIVQVRNSENLAELQRRYPKPETIRGMSNFGSLIDWDEVAKDFDGVNLTKEGEYKTRFSSPTSLYGWDCESTVWFKDVLKKKRDITADDLKCDIR